MAAVAEPAAHGYSVHKRRVNGLIQESLGDHMDDQPIAYFCECPSGRCFETVWLTSDQYESGRRSPRWLVLAPGHRAGRAD